MHLPDGFVSGPVNLATGVVSLGTCAAAVAQARKSLGEKQVPLLGVTAAFIFAAQMLNFPVAAGTSGHFLGACLAAILLGPLNAVLIMALVMTIQCLVFGDGGLTALGSNIFNMGIVGALGGWAIYRLLLALLPTGRSGQLAASFTASLLSVVASAAFCSWELALSGTVPLAISLPAMAGVHSLIGIGEGLITATVVGMVLAVRPDLLRGAVSKLAISGGRSK